MRIRLQWLLPLALAGFVAAGFLVVGFLVGGAVRGSLTTVPGLTVGRAVEAAVRVVVLAGVVVTTLSALAGAFIARVIVTRLARLRAVAEGLAAGDAGVEGDTRVAEIQDTAREVQRVAAELRDRHDRAAGERSELAGLVETVSEGIIQLTAEGRIVRVNRAARELLALPRDAADHSVGTLFRNAELRTIMERGATGERTEPAEVVIGDRRILVSVNSRGQAGAVATIVDLTDLRRLEEVRRDFVANASHELKTPLTSIRGYAETLLGGELSDTERAQFLSTISRNTERLQRIVDDLLDLSRLDAGRWQPELEAVDVLDVARDAWRPFADRAADRGVSFTAETGTGRQARVDPRALEQVFANLYDNALRHTEAGDRIRVAIEEGGVAPGGAGPGGPIRPGAAGPERGAGLVVAVADTGAGIPRDALPRIFERFYRVDPARSRAEGGTGLGLSIVRHMLESMGGAVEARSELGKGTTLRLWLPAAD